jgi:hypothetical protein
MSWQQRSGQKYYYRARREGKQVTHDYFGIGPVAWAAAAMDVEERNALRTQAEAKTAIRRLFEEADAHVERLIAASDDLVRAILLSEGFYRHQRGTWRRRNWAYVQHESESGT